MDPTISRPNNQSDSKKDYSTFNNNFTVNVIGSAIDVSSISWYARSSATEGIFFMSKEIIKRCPINENVDINGFGSYGFPDDVIVHTCVKKNKDDNESHGYVVITDKEYNNRLAHVLGQEAILHPDQISILLNQYQKPEEVDKLVRIKIELEDTKEIMQKNISQLHLNKEQLERLVATSDELSRLSKTFVNNSKKLNKCCNLI